MNGEAIYLAEHQDRYRSDLGLVRQYYQEGEILEVGSVPCYFTSLLKKENYPVTGLDLAPERAREIIQKNNLEIVKCDVEKEKILFEDNKFSLVLLNEVFEHLRINPVFTLREINRVLKKDGVMILTTPNLYSLGRIFRFLTGRSFNDAYSEFEKLQTIGHAGHIREYSTREIKKFLEKTGFKVVRIDYKVYNKDRGGKFWCYQIFVPFRPFQVIISTKC